jgi:hypothetical protein
VSVEGRGSVERIVVLVISASLLVVASSCSSHSDHASTTSAVVHSSPPPPSALRSLNAMSGTDREKADAALSASSRVAFSGSGPRVALPRTLRAVPNSWRAQRAVGSMLVDAVGASGTTMEYLVVFSLEAGIWKLSSAVPFASSGGQP